MVHILNGDALREQLPSSMAGRQIVARECLVDGDVAGQTLEQIAQSREEFLLEVYGVPLEEYRDQSLAELKRIQQIPNGEEIALWFEDDLFCQVNLWFVCWLLDETGRNHPLYLVRPPADSRYSFASVDETGLSSCFEARTQITPAERSALAGMWKAYQYEDRIAMHRLATGPLRAFDFLLPVIDAEVTRYRDESGWSPMEKTVAQIIQSNPDGDFPAHYTTFSRAFPVYGLGDLQFKRVWEEVNERI